MLFEKIEFEANENVISTVRKHWFVITSELIVALMFSFLPIVVLLFLNSLPEYIPLNVDLSAYSSLIVFASAVWVLLTLLSAFMIWTHYYLDLWVITDHRIIVIDQIHFFNRKVSSFRLERLQDIKVSINGIVPTFLNYGTLRAQTASAAESNFMTTGLPDPRGLQSMIQKATDERLRSLQGTLETTTD
ncbi:MAG: hypothetical protein UW75_C0009G0005 [Parcubacteria group bacterium GW2011_GWF2_44_8]|nr:MAG: hypothetical protein UW75_C0009G0005 [Parcubacteria group bacterium GW2011_GWF2_44_8]